MNIAYIATKQKCRICGLEEVDVISLAGTATKNSCWWHFLVIVLTVFFKWLHVSMYHASKYQSVIHKRTNNFVLLDDTIADKIAKWVAGCFSHLVLVSHFATKCLILFSYVNSFQNMVNPIRAGGGWISPHFFHMAISSWKKGSGVGL